MNNMKLEAINNNLILELIDFSFENKTEGGIILPDKSVEKLPVGIIVSKSKSIKENTLKEGDKVLYKRYEGVKTDIEGKKYLIIDISNIISKVNE